MEESNFTLVETKPMEPKETLQSPVNSRLEGGFIDLVLLEGEKEPDSLRVGSALQSPGTEAEKKTDYMLFILEQHLRDDDQKLTAARQATNGMTRASMFLCPQQRRRLAARLLEGLE